MIQEGGSWEVTERSPGSKRLWSERESRKRNEGGRAIGKDAAPLALRLSLQQEFCPHISTDVPELTRVSYLNASLFMQEGRRTHVEKKEEYVITKKTEQICEQEWQ